MKKIKMVFVSILLVVAFLVGCAPDQKIFNDQQKTDRSVNDGMFTTIYNVVDRINQVPAADLSGWKRIVFCGECDHTQRTDDHEIWCTGRGSPCQLVAPDGFCDKAKARVQE